MAATKTAARSKTTKPASSKKAAKASATTAGSDAKVKKTTKKAESGIKKSPTPYNVFFKANYARVKEEHPELLSKEMMAKMAEIWKLEPSNPKSANFVGPPPPKTAQK